jgi:hypothetical protein
MERATPVTDAEPKLTYDVRVKWYMSLVQENQ